MMKSKSCSSKESKALSPVELADNFRRQVIETTRRSMAMQRHGPEGLCRWRRAATRGPNSELALVFLRRRGQPPEVEIWPYAKIERLAAEVADEEVFAEIERRRRCHQEPEGDAP